LATPATPKTIARNTFASSSAVSMSYSPCRLPE
jgi:hypothetical protein